MDRDKEVPYMEDHQEIVRETRKYDATGTLGTAGKLVQNQLGIDKEYIYIYTWTSKRAEKKGCFGQ